jgi:hypothetical protein
MAIPDRAGRDHPAEADERRHRGTRRRYAAQLCISGRSAAYAGVQRPPAGGRLGGDRGRTFRHGDELQRQIIEINNELAVLAREHAAKNKELTAAKRELEKALHEINTLYWHIRRIREVLPMCLKCGKVHSGETHWEAVAESMIQRFRFLSHGYCPECASRELAEGSSTRDHSRNIRDDAL